MSKIDPSIPRKQFWTDRVPNKHRCPICRSKLEKDYQVYMFVVQDGEETPAHIAGNDLGAFCPQCPIVVLDMKEFAREAAETIGWEENRPLAFWVVGIIDLTAIPEDKKDIPIGSDDNPVPLVSFVDTVEGDTSTQRERKRLSGNQRRRLRKNQDRSNA